MIALIQRVSSASVSVAGTLVGRIERGLLAYVAVRPDDGPANVERLLERVLGYRVFDDEAGRMNLSLREVGGGLLLVSQFTLAANTDKGMRAGFSTAAPPERAGELFAALVTTARAVHQPVATGRFGSTMRVESVNEGPVTFWLEG
ncbi:MAG: D-aminoacyl-tRNA deacylase [Steroidobacteraceae bacterium]